MGWNCHWGEFDTFDSKNYIPIQWSTRNKNDIKDTFTAAFYANTIFGGLVSEANVQLVADALAVNAPSTLEANMTNVVDNLLDDFVNAMTDFSADQTNATLVRGVM